MNVCNDNSDDFSNRVSYMRQGDNDSDRDEKRGCTATSKTEDNNYDGDDFQKGPYNYPGGALTYKGGMGMCRGHDPLFSGQSALLSLPIYHHCAALMPPIFKF